jgi:hypothetical protein
MNFEVRIGQDILRNGIAIVVFDRRYKDLRVINLYTGETKELKDFEEIPQEFIMKLSNIIAQDFLQALAEALDKNGIKTDKDAKIQGLLEAQNKHLQDMRRLVFNKTQPPTHNAPMRGKRRR